MITRVGETVNKIAYKMEEGDTWFEEKTLHVEQMETQLKKLYSIVENVVTCRRELAFATGIYRVSQKKDLSLFFRSVCQQCSSTGQL